MLGQRLGLCYGQFHGSGTDRASGIRDDTVGAEVDATILHLQHGAGTAFQTACRQHFKFPPPQGVVYVAAMLTGVDSCEDFFNKAFPIGAAANHIYPQFFQCFGSVLGVAAAHSHDCFGVFPPAAADHGPVLLICHSSDRAGIDDIAVAGLCKGTRNMATGEQKLLHCLGLVLINLAAKGIKSDLHC